MTREYNQKYYIKNKERMNEACKKYYLEHKKELIEKKKKYAKNHPEKKNIWQRNTMKNLKFNIFTKLGNKCKKCGIMDIRVLQIDHINGGGVKERKSFSSPGTYLRNVLKNSNKYQLLCANCNWIKRYEKGEYNHV